MEPLTKKRLGTTLLVVPNAKRKSIAEAHQDSLVELPTPTIFYSNDLDVIANETTYDQDDFDLLPVEVVERIVKFVLPPDGFDDTDFCSLCLVNKRRREMWSSSDLQPTLRITSKESPFVSGKRYFNFRKLFLSSNQEERRRHVTMPIKFTDVIIITSCLSNLLHLSIDLHRPTYKTIIPFLPAQLESLHLSSWSLFGDAFGDLEKMFHSGTHLHDFRHLKNLVRLSLFADKEYNELLGPLERTYCRRFQLPCTLETLHIPNTFLDVTKSDNEMLCGWSNIKTLSIARIQGDALEFYLPLLQTLVCHDRFDVSPKREDTYTLVASFQNLFKIKEFYIPGRAGLVHLVIPKQEHFYCITKILQLRRNFILFRDQLVPINACRPLQLPWLPK